MDERIAKEISGLFVKVIKQRDAQGQGILLDSSKIDYGSKLLHELDLIEYANDELKDELRLLSKFIRNKLWRYETIQVLYIIIHWLNSSFQIISEAVGWQMIFDINALIEYISFLAKYKAHYYKDINETDFEVLVDAVLKTHYSKLIKSQWDDVLEESGGMETFIKVFNDVFTNAVETYEEKFIYHLSENELLSRCVKKESCDENRFIPKPNEVQNRWNPPGKTYLYTAFKEQNIAGVPDGITGGQYICLIECRTKHNTHVCFCDFKPVVPGRILDLSYNDLPLYSYRMMISDEADRVKSRSVSRLLNDPEIYIHYGNKKFIKEKIKTVIEDDSASIDVITESIAKQYLKYICDCIYTKVDDDDEVGKERAYRSFHILAVYLESRGITGVIYPCTRIDGMHGKNVVLFNADDATPVKGSIVKYLFT